MCLLAALLIAPACRRATPESEPVPAPATAGARAAQRPVIASGRPVFKYSVIPGGVQDAAELKRAAEHDAVVASHYRDVNVPAVRRTVLTADRHAYVSYRRGDRVYWTKNKVRIPAGEAVLTDGKNEIRERCGNRLSDDPLLPIAQEEPPPIEFEALLPEKADTESTAASAGASDSELPGANLGANDQLFIRNPTLSANTSTVIPSSGGGGGAGGSGGGGGIGAGSSNGGSKTNTEDKDGTVPGSSGNPSTPGSRGSDGGDTTGNGDNGNGGGTGGGGGAQPPAFGPPNPPGGTPDTPGPGSDPHPGGGPDPKVSEFEREDDDDDDSWLPHDGDPPTARVPEPGTLILVGAGVGLAARYLRGRRRK